MIVFLILIYSFLKPLSYIEYVEIHDSNFEKSLIEQKIDTDGSLNGRVAKSDIVNVKVLSLADRKIKTLDGIEGFISLEKLFISKNDIEILNLQNNKNLELLNCDSNKLISLNLSQNRLLTQLMCNKNKIDTLDLSKNQNLKYLHCQDSQIKSINIKRNKFLKILICNSNLLNDIDLSDAINLNYINCGNNLLNQLDVSNNLDLETLLCYGNKLSKLNVSQNKKIRILMCQSNNITEIDISQSFSLEELYCFNNKLTNLDLTNNNKLIKFNCTKNQINQINVISPINNDNWRKDDFTRYVEKDIEMPPQLNINKNSLFLKISILEGEKYPNLLLEDSLNIEFHSISQNPILKKAKRISNNTYEVNDYPKKYFNGIIISSKVYYGAYDCINLKEDIVSPLEFYIGKRSKLQFIEFGPCPDN